MPKGKAKPFPRVTFEEALEIGNAIQKFASGEKVRKLTLFEHINKAPDSGPSRQLITNSSKYGITTGGYQAEFIELTPEGKIATSEDVSEVARIEARIKLSIKSISIFDFLFEKLKGNKLPSKQVIIDIIKEFGIKDKDVAEECVDLFIINLKFLGLLKTISGNERIISIEHRLEEVGDKKSISVFSESKELVPKLINKNIENACFYITPIGEEGSEQRKHSDLFFSSIVEPVVDKFDMELIRADKISKPGLINNQIIDYLLRSKLVIADLSYHNPNVFYEIAIRHLCKKPIVQIKRASDSIPFDIQQVRTISIDTTDIYTLVPKLEVYKSEIANQIRSALENPELVDNPLSQHYEILKDIMSKKNLTTTPNA
jgi:hypothetical protein